MFLFKNARGKKVVLLNPAEKGVKYATELKNNVKLTNTGICKTDKKGRCRKLSKAERAYRSGYLQSRKDSANAYLSSKVNKGRKNKLMLVSR